MGSNKLRFSRRESSILLPLFLALAFVPPMWFLRRVEAAQRSKQNSPWVDRALDALDGVVLGIPWLPLMVCVLLLIILWVLAVTVVFRTAVVMFRRVWRTAE